MFLGRAAGLYYTGYFTISALYALKKACFTQRRCASHPFWWQVY